MKYNPEIHHRRSIRLREHDYAQAGEYYLTICVKNRQCLLGEIFQDQVKLSHIGAIAKACWKGIPQHFLNAELDAFVIMPNHIHGIIDLTDLVGTRHAVSPQGKSRERRTEQFGKPVCASLSTIIRSFKSAATNRIHAVGFSAFAWQSGFYEHVIRNAKDLGRIRRYILENPPNWNPDDEHPSNVKPNREQMSYEDLSDLS